jgi:hypothetical protein
VPGAEKPGYRLPVRFRPDRSRARGHGRLEHLVHVVTRERGFPADRDDQLYGPCRSSDELVPSAVDSATGVKPKDDTK